MVQAEQSHGRKSPNRQIGFPVLHSNRYETKLAPNKSMLLEPAGQRQVPLTALSFLLCSGSLAGDFRIARLTMEEEEIA
jgi:hypothetical protein